MVRRFERGRIVLFPSHRRNWWWGNWMARGAADSREHLLGGGCSSCRFYVPFPAEPMHARRPRRTSRFFERSSKDVSPTPATATSRCELPGRLSCACQFCLN